MLRWLDYAGYNRLNQMDAIGELKDLKYTRLAVSARGGVKVKFVSEKPDEELEKYLIGLGVLDSAAWTKYACE